MEEDLLQYVKVHLLCVKCVISKDQWQKAPLENVKIKLLNIS